MNDDARYSKSGGSWRSTLENQTSPIQPPMDFGPFALTWPNALLGFLLLNKIYSCGSMHIAEGSW